MGTPVQIGLFEGYGGLTRAVTNTLGAELIAYSEIEPAACRLLEHHHPDVPNLGDITQIDWTKIERDFRRKLILTGGFPCTDVSAAGLQLGLYAGTRSGLWAHMAYAIEQLRPDLVVIENVRGLLTARGAEPTSDLLAAWDARDKAKRVLSVIESKLRRAQREGNMPYVHRHQRDRGRFLGRLRQAVAAAKRADALIVRAIGTVLGDLADLGFDAQWCGLRAADVGAPHGRYRIFITAWPATRHADSVDRNGWTSAELEGEARPPARSATDPASVRREERRPEPARIVGRPDVVLGSALAPTDPAGVGSARSGAARVRRAGSADDDLAAADADSQRPQGRRIRGRTGSAPVGDSAPAAAHTVRDRREGGKERHLWQEAGQPAPLGGDAARRVLEWGDYTPAIRRWELILGRPAPAPTQTGMRGGQQLSPLFVEWMQGLPEGWVTGVPGLSRNEQLKMLGNGVVAQQAEAALRHMLASNAIERAA